MTQIFTHPSVRVCDHPLVHHNLSIVRDKNSNSEQFRIAIRRVAQFILQEATRELPLIQVQIETPVTNMQARKLASDIPIIIMPILRAGLIMGEMLIDLIPLASTYHIGIYRDATTLQPIIYYNKLASTVDYSKAHIFVLDPMLATGGSVCAAIDIIRELGVKEQNITFACIISSPQGIKVLTESHPDIKIYTGVIDECLNDQAYIVPGLGDAGDRAFGT